jgi:hypothetical protein
MAFTAAVSARNAENDRTNDPGMCLQQVRMWCGIGARYADASTAWRNTNDRHPGSKAAPRGSAVYWTGGSRGYGHICLSLGNGKVRSTDAGGRGRVATVDIDWVSRNWGHTYAGWAWDINEVTIPHRTVQAKVKAAVDTNWERTRMALLATLNSDAAKGISKSRKKVTKFIEDTKKALAALPKE